MTGKDEVKLILVTGSVVSGVGKGIISSSLGVLLKENGYRVSAIKIDPYINVDAGTFSPYEHGEVFVLDDGGEVDLDLGNYERFMNIRLTFDNNITTGKIYKHVIESERRGEYLGRTVQTVPHVTSTIISWVERVARIPVDGSDKAPDVCIVELGGTVGDVENMPYTKAFSDNLCQRRQRERFMCVHVTKLLTSNCEVKTKPAQNGIGKLRETGLFPDLIILRSEARVDSAIFDKFSPIDKDRIVNVYDMSSIYEVPLLLHEQRVMDIIREQLKLPLPLHRPVVVDMAQWRALGESARKYTETVTIALVGKYVSDKTGKVFEDAYASVFKALRHSAIHARRKLKIECIKSEMLEDGVDGDGLDAERLDFWRRLKTADGIIVPGGFGKRGFEGIVASCKYARENKIPFLGVCLGMQCAAVEFARHVCGLADANSTENSNALAPEKQIVIDMPEHDGHGRGMGGTMRLGKRTTVFLTHNSTLRRLYGDAEYVEERHRHRYEVNPRVVPVLSSKGLLFVGMGVDERMEVERPNADNLRTASSAALVRMAESTPGDDLAHLLAKIDELCVRGGDGVDKTAVRMEMCELSDHPYFVGVQYHPEYLSHPLKPSPPFYGLLLAASGQLAEFLQEHD